MKQDVQLRPKSLPNGGLLTISDVLFITGFKSRVTIYRYVKSKTFPPPCVVNGKSIRWRQDDVQRWVNALPHEIA